MKSVGSANKGKKVYGKPMLIAEEFVPNEYVAACQPVNGVTQKYLSCDGGDDNKNHSEDGCLRPTAYEISIDAQGRITRIYEAENNSGVWNGGAVYDIEIYDKKGGTKLDAIGDVSNGTYYLRWKTWPFTVMQHCGVLDLSTAQTVNMS